MKTNLRTFPTHYSSNEGGAVALLYHYQQWRKKFEDELRKEKIELEELLKKKRINNHVDVHVAMARGIIMEINNILGEN